VISYYHPIFIDSEIQNINMVMATILILLFSLPLIVKGCEPQWVGDGYCDRSCNNRKNKFDDGDCANISA
jgi:hypothetical protein